MSVRNDFSTQTNNYPSMVKRMIIGGTIALAFIGLFLYSAGKSDPAWARSWMIQPLIITPIAGIMGGAFSYFIKQFYLQGHLSRNLSIVVSVIAYLVALWMGVVLGLDGTLWD